MTCCRSILNTLAATLCALLFLSNSVMALPRNSMDFVTLSNGFCRPDGTEFDIMLFQGDRLPCISTSDPKFGYVGINCCSGTAVPTFGLIASTTWKCAPGQCVNGQLIPNTDSVKSQVATGFDNKACLREKARFTPEDVTTYNGCLNRAAAQICCSGKAVRVKPWWDFAGVIVRHFASEKVEFECTNDLGICEVI